MPESWSEFMQSIRRGDETQADIAERAGGIVDQTTVSRWLLGTGRPSVEKAVAFARAIGESPIRALIALNYLKPEDIEGEVRVNLSSAEMSDADLIREVQRRMHPRINPDAPSV